MTPEDIARLQEEENRRKAAAGMLVAQQGRTPSQVAEADRLARKYNVGTPLVESDPKPFQELETRDATDMLTDLNPWTTKHLIDNPDTAAMLTQPDISKVGNISAALGMDKPTHDYSLKKINPLPVTPPSDFGPTTPQVSFSDLMSSTARRVLQYAPMATQAVTLGPGAVIAPHVIKFGQEGYQDYLQSGETAPQYLSRYARAAPGEVLLGTVGAAQGVLGLMEGATSLASAAVGAQDPLYDWYRQQDQIAEATQKLYTPTWAKSDFQQGVLSGMQSLTQMALTAPLGSDIPWALGGMVTGQGINQFRSRGAGALPSVLGGLAQGAIEVGTERYLGGFGHGAVDAGGLGNSYLTKLFTRDAVPSVRATANFLWHEVAGEQIATAGQNFVDFLVPGSQFKSWSDYLHQAPSQAMQTLWATLLMGGSLGATNHALGMFRSTVGDYKASVESVFGHEVLDQIMENAKDAPMRKASPQAFAEFVDAGAKDSPVTHVYVPVEAVDRVLNDPEIPQEEKAALTVYQSQIDEARVNNGDVVIPVGEAAAHLAGTKVWDNIKDDTRVLAGGISAKEAHQHMDELIGNLEKIGDETIKEGNAAMPQLEAKQQVYNEVKAQVAAAGRSQREAQTTAALLASRAEALASDRYGQFKDAKEAWDWMQLHIQGPEAKPAKGAKKVAQSAFKDLPNLLSRNDWAIMTAENPNAQQLSPEENIARNEELKATLDRMGLKYTPVRGKYGNDENSFAIEGITHQQAQNLGRRFGQESVLTHRGLVYGDNTVNPSRGVNILSKDAPDFFTELPTGEKFSVDINFDQRVPIKDSGPTYQQSAVDIQHRPLEVEGSGPGGQVTNDDMYHALTDRQRAVYGRELDPMKSEEDYRTVVQALVDEHGNQRETSDDGGDWYRGDVNRAIEITKEIFPELDDPMNRDMFLIVTALLSPQQSPIANWDNAMHAMAGYFDSGKFALARPSGLEFGVDAQKTGLQLLQHLVDTMGSLRAIEWLQSNHTGRELAEIRREAGIFKGGNKIRPVQDFLASEVALGDTVPGMAIFGPKVSDFAANVTGIDQRRVTIDSWAASTYNRITGQLLKGNPQKPRGKAERKLMQRLFTDAANEVGVSPSAMQAQIWYFEQRLYRNHGIDAPSTTFSEAAEKAAIERGADINRLVQRVAARESQNAGRGADALFRANSGTVIAEDENGFPFEDVLSSQGDGRVDPTVYRQFGGRLAGANDAELSSRLSTAQTLESAGETPEQIWTATGWARGPEGQWRFEIDDSKSEIKSLPSPDRVDYHDLMEQHDGKMPSEIQRTGVPLLRAGATTYLVGERLDQVLEHPDLFRHYPQLANLPVFMEDLEPRENGYFNGVSIVLNSNANPIEIQSTLHHEIQHAIQTIEGFAHGAQAAPGVLRDMGLGDALDEELKYLTAVNNGEVPNMVFPRKMTDAELLSSAAFNTYERVAGEAEARSVQLRQSFTPEERRRHFPDFSTTEFGDPVLLPSRDLAFAAQSTSGPQTPRGETTFYPSGKTIVQLFKADASTMLHEMSHVFLEQEFKLAQMKGASDQLKADVDKLQKWFKDHGADFNGTAEEKTAAHELFARTGERYFREGKAPSADLRSAFKQFREWLTSVYKNVRDLLAYGPAPINPEIRDIFDRIIATDDAIQRNATEPMSQEELGMTSAEYQAYLDSVNNAHDAAYDTMLEKMMKAIRQREQKAIRVQRANVRDEVAQDVNKEPRFVALHLLRTGRWLNDPNRAAERVKLNTGWLIDNYGEEILKQLPVGLQPIHKGDGVNGDAVAELVGMKSGDELVRSLLDMKRQADQLKADGNPRPLRDQIIEDHVNQIMAKRHGDIMTPEQIKEEAVAALNSNRQGEVLATELRQLKKKAAQPGVITPYQILREWARRKANEGTVADAVSKDTLNRYIRLYNKAQNAFEAAILKGDTDEAIKQKQAQMINHALLAEGKKVADDINSIVRRMQRYAKTKALASIDQDYMDRIHELLEGYNFRTVSNKVRNEQASFEEWAKRQRDQGNEVYVPERFRDDRTNWKDAQVSKLLELNDMVDSLAHLGRLKQKLMVADQERRLDEIRDEAEASALALPERHLGDASVGEITKPLRQRLREAKTFAQYAAAIGELFRPGKRVRQAAAGLVKIEGVADILDQTKMGTGAFNRVLIRGATDAANKYSQLREEVLSGIADAYHAMSGTLAARLNDHVTINELTLRAGLHADDPRLGQPLDITRRQLLALVANTGNLSNLSKLVGGERWGDPESMVDMTKVQQTLIGYLNKEEMDFVQSLWDGMQKMWPHIVEVERMMTGVVPEAVVPMEVSTPWGPYKGGYWPVVWDSDRTNLGKPDEETSEANLFGVGSGLGTYKGHTISRTSAMGPMDWSLERVLFSRTNQILSRIAYAPFIRDSLKLINTPRVSGAIKLRLGNEYYSAMKSWLRDQIPSNAQDVQGAKFWEKMLTAARVNMTATVLGISYSVGIAQTEGLTYSAGVLGEGNLRDGPKWIAAGFQKMVQLMRSDGPGAQEFVFTRSEEMRRRAHELNREVADVFNRLDDRSIGRLGHIQRQLQAAAFWHVAFIDLNTVSIPTWLGGYEKAKAQGMSEEDAAAYADKVVRLSQGTGREKDMSAIQRGNAGQRMIAMFYTPSSVFFNQQWEAAQHMKAGNWSKALAPTFWFLIANTLIDAYRGGDWPPQDEDGNIDLESIAKWVGRNLFFGLFYGVPIVRDVANTANTKLRGQYADWGSTPISYGAQSIAKAGTSVMKSIHGQPLEGFDIKREATAAGWLLGLPGLQIGRTAGFIKDVHDGKEDPQSIGDWFRGLTSGSSPKKS